MAANDRTASQGRPPIFVIFGEERERKLRLLNAALDELLPPDIDRSMALSEYDGARGEEQGGPAFAAVADDLRTLSFLADRRVVVVREADTFIQRYRENLERYAAAPAPSGTLVLECRSFPKTTRLYKAIYAAHGRIEECKKLSPRDAIEFVFAEARQRGKRVDPATANRLVDLIGTEQGMLSNEIEKLSLFVGERPLISNDDVSELVGQTREEKIFAVMDAAYAGDAAEALRRWRHVLATDSSAAFKAIGGMAFTVRKRLEAHRLLADGLPMGQVAPKVMMWGREADLNRQLRRLPARRLERLLADMADLDARAKTGLRSMDLGIESLLVGIAAPAA